MRTVVRPREGTTPPPLHPTQGLKGTCFTGAKKRRELKVALGVCPALLAAATERQSRAQAQVAEASGLKPAVQSGQMCNASRPPRPPVNDPHADQEGGGGSTERITGVRLGRLSEDGQGSLQPTPPTARQNQGPRGRVGTSPVPAQRCGKRGWPADRHNHMTAKARPGVPR